MHFSPEIRQNYPFEYNVNNRYCHVRDAHPALPAAEQDSARVMGICLTQRSRRGCYSRWTSNTVQHMEKEARCRKKCLRIRGFFLKKKDEEKYAAWFSACTYSHT